jgi:hypothetical protein
MWGEKWDVDYEFENIESLTRQLIAAAKGPNSSAGKQFNDIKSSISAEIARAERSFALKVLSFEAIRQAELVVRYHQLSLTTLLDELFNLSGSISEQSKAKRNSNSLHVITEIQLLLEDLLQSIQILLPDYFDLDSPAPKSAKEKALLEIKEGSDQLEVSLSRFSIDPDLRVSALSVFTDFLKAHDQPITFRQVSCVRALAAQLLELTSNALEASPIDNQVRTILLNVNCNQNTCVGYFMHFLAMELSSAETISDKLERLALHYKTVSHTQTRSDFSFHVEQASLKMQVLEWLVEEIAFYERKRELNLGPSGKPDELIATDFKLIFDLSVAQFACFIKVLTETGVVQNKNQSELFRFLVRFVKTKRSENISYDSFRTRYFNVESNTKGAVSNLLHTCIGHIDAN